MRRLPKQNIKKEGKLGENLVKQCEKLTKASTTNYGNYFDFLREFSASLFCSTQEEKKASVTKNSIKLNSNKKKHQQREFVKRH